MSSSAFFFLKAQFMYHVFLWTLTATPDTGACDVGNRQSWAEIAASWGDGGSLRLKLTGRPVRGGSNGQTWRGAQGWRQRCQEPRRPGGGASINARASSCPGESPLRPRRHLRRLAASELPLGSPPACTYPESTPGLSGGPNHSEPMAAPQKGRGLPPRDQEERQPDDKVGNSSN